jgi:hypothetical protein
MASVHDVTQWPDARLREMAAASSPENYDEDIVASMASELLRLRQKNIEDEKARNELLGRCVQRRGEVERLMASLADLSTSAWGCVTPSSGDGGARSNLIGSHKRAATVYNEIARSLGRSTRLPAERPIVCVLCGEPWEPPVKNRCECGGFCTWGEAKGAQPDSWTAAGPPRAPEPDLWVNKKELNDTSITPTAHRLAPESPYLDDYNHYVPASRLDASAAVTAAARKTALEEAVREIEEHQAKWRTDYVGSSVSVVLGELGRVKLRIRALLPSPQDP